MKTTLSEAIIEFDLSMIGSHSVGTRKLYGYTTHSLLENLGNVDLETINISHLRRWAAKIHEQDLSIHTKHRHIRQARRFFKWCVEEGFLTCSPAIRLKLPKLPRGEPPKAVSESDLDRLLEIACQGEIRDYAILRLLAESGCRLGGLINMKPDDIDFEKNKSFVREKGNDTRNVFFGEVTAAVLRSYLVERPLYLKGGQKRNRNCQRRDDALFLGRCGNLTSSGVYRLLERLAKRAEVEGRFNPHAHRHALARRMLKHNADLGTVSQTLGHSNIETTHRFYARWSEGELAKRHREYGGILE